MNCVKFNQWRRLCFSLWLAI